MQRLNKSLNNQKGTSEDKICYSMLWYWIYAWCWVNLFILESFFDGSDDSTILDLPVFVLWRTTSLLRVRNAMKSVD